MSVISKIIEAWLTSNTMMKLNRMHSCTQWYDVYSYLNSDSGP